MTIGDKTYTDKETAGQALLLVQEYLHILVKWQKFIVLYIENLVTL